MPLISMFSMYGGYGYGYRQARQTEPDYMDICKPHFDLSTMSASSGHNALAAIKQAKKEAMSEDALAYDTTLAPGLATEASLLTDKNTKKVELDNYTLDTKKCVECGAPSVFACRQCVDVFCRACYMINHRRGKRVLHKYDLVEAMNDTEDSSEKSQSSESSEKSGILGSLLNAFKSPKDKKDMTPSAHPSTASALTFADHLGEWWAGRAINSEWFVERARYIPLRLSHEERRFLRLLEGVMKASGYTDKVDMKKHKNKKDRIRKCAQEIVAVLQALVAHADVDKSKELMRTGDFAQYAEYFQHVFEVGRRHKIRNPEKMRSTYGTLLFLLQDTQIPEVQEFLGFSCVRPIYTVYSLLEERNGLDLLRDPLLAVATQEIVATGKTRSEIDRVSQQKRKAFETLVSKYHTSQLSKETIKLAIYSIADNHSYLRCNRDPCNEMLGYLQTYFKATGYSRPEESLEIVEGEGGARLSHSHSVQYHYVLQSLCLWRDILDDFFKLWCLSEQDLLDTAQHPYELTETGQGVHRLQQAPRTDRALREIVCRVQMKAGNWVGSSVIHLGDRNVPNSLMFIDKYNQVGKILNPVCIALRNMSKLLVSDDNNPRASVVAVRNYLDVNYDGDIEKAKLDVLRDFFMHAFDGSGSDNFFEAGSCIDGRLTSAWEWCNAVTSSSNLDKAGKKFYPLFLMTEFAGFDGAEWD